MKGSAVRIRASALCYFQGFLPQRLEAQAQTPMPPPCPNAPIFRNRRQVSDQSRSVWWRVALTCAAGVALASPAVASQSRDALLRPGVGVGKLRLGMTQAEAVRALGKPALVRRRERDGRRGYVEYSWGRNASDWIVGFGSLAGAPRALFITTTRPERTRAGVGVGSTRTQLRRELGARCYRQRNELPGADPIQPWIGCYLGRGRRGEPMTFFDLDIECSIPTDHFKPCPHPKRTYRAYQATLFSAIGQRLLGVDEPI
jgi:hypothetical protein